MAAFLLRDRGHAFEARLLCTQQPNLGLLNLLRPTRQIKRQQNKKSSTNERVGINMNEASTTDAEQPLNTFYDDDESVGAPEPDGTDVASIKKRIFLKCCLINIFVVVAVLVVIVAVVISQAHALTQSIINSATIVLANATMYDPTGSTIMLNASIALNNAGPFDATVQSFECDIYDEAGTHFAKMTMPEMTVIANSPSPMDLTNEVTIINSTCFTDAAGRLLQGKPGKWTIKGSATVNPTIAGITVTMNDVMIDSTLPLPATLLTGVEAYNTQIVGSSKNSLICTADTSFFSSSVLSISHLGPTTFKLYTSKADGSIGSVPVGLATMTDFNVVKGMNHLSGAVINLTKTDENVHVVAQLLETWARGEDQTVFLSGPTASGILDGVVVQSLTMRGVSENVITASMIEHDYSFQGHSATTGEACSLLDNKNCLRGALMIMKNPGPFPLRLKNVGFDVDWTTPKKYKVTLSVLDIKYHYDCPFVPEKLAYMYSTKGMYTYENKSLADVDYITLPGNASTSSFIAGTFQPGQVAPDGKDDPDLCGTVIKGYTCCFASKFAAASCYSLSKGLNYIPATTTGNATIVAGDFEIDVVLSQKVLDIFFANNIPDMSVDGVTATCSDFEFYD